MKNIEFGQRLKKLREEMTVKEGIKITQDMVGKAIGVADKYYQRLEAGHMPSSETVVALGEYFQCSIDWLLCGNGEPYQSDLIKSPGVCGYKKDEVGYAPPERPAPMHVREQAVNYRGSGIDPYRAGEQLYKILASRDPTFTQAIVANLNSFAQAIDQKKENQDLRNELNSMKQRIAALEAGVQREGGVVQGDTSDEETGRTIEKKAV